MRHDLILPTILSLLLAPLLPSAAHALSCEEPITELHCVVTGLEQIRIPCVRLTHQETSCYIIAEYTCDDESTTSITLKKYDTYGDISFYLKRNKDKTIDLYDSRGEQREIILEWRHQTTQDILMGAHQLQYSGTLITDGDDYDCVGDDCSFYCASTPAKTPPAPLYAALIALITWRHRRRQP